MSSTSATRAVRRSARLRPKATFSATVICGNSAQSWNTIPTRRCSGTTHVPLASLSTRPPTVTRPASGRSRPAIDRSKSSCPNRWGRAARTPAPAPRSSDTPRSTSVAPNRLAMPATESEDPAMAVVREA